MAVYRRNYRPYSGTLTPPWSRFLVLFRYSRRNLFRSKIQTGFFVLCFFYPLACLVMIYLAHSASFLAKLGLPSQLISIDNMKVCPNNALQPALTEAGFEGLWTPVLVPRLGYCETSCVLCSQVCPTGAIWEITAREKGWSVDISSAAKPVRLGTAFYDRGRCLPWAMVCEETASPLIPVNSIQSCNKPCNVTAAGGELRSALQSKCEFLRLSV